MNPRVSAACWGHGGTSTSNVAHMLLISLLASSSSSSWQIQDGWDKQSLNVFRVYPQKIPPAGTVCKTPPQGIQWAPPRENHLNGLSSRVSTEQAQFVCGRSNSGFYPTFMTERGSQ